ncbi:MAG TPA: alpha/beta hydrolase [Symbiobacteriaceae bacterium]|nr:alpha/beta hydrolase [Symbiobacteriaceae bacterium]
MDLHVRTWGEGERVVLLHGAHVADPGRTWGEQRELANRYQLVIPDRRGHGESPDYVGPGFEATIADVLELLGEGAHLAGLSYGAIVAMLVAVRSPGRVKSLTLIEPPAFHLSAADPSVRGLMERLLPAYAESRTPEEFIRRFGAAFGDDEEEEEAFELPPGLRRAIATHMMEPAPWEAEFDLPALAACAFPKWLVTGGWHGAFEAVAQVLAPAIGAEWTVFPGAGHGVQRTGKPFNDRFEALLASAK